ERAFNSWDSVVCSGNQPPSIRLRNVVDAGGSEYPTADAGDQENVVYWLESSAEWKADSLTLAITTNKVANNGVIITSDMAVNGADFSWRARNGSGVFEGCSQSGADGSRCFDIEAVALHEVGHFVGLNHVPCTDAVMYPQQTASGGPVVLSLHEQAALCAV